MPGRLIARHVPRLLLTLAIVVVVVPVILVVLVNYARSPADRTITVSQAMAHVERLVQDAVDAAPRGQRFELEDRTESGGTNCTKGLDEFTGQVTAELEYLASGISNAESEQFLVTMKRYWTSRGYHVEQRPDMDGMIVAELEIDGYDYRLLARHFPAVRAVSVYGDSECLWENGTPEPGDNP